MKRVVPSLLEQEFVKHGFGSYPVMHHLYRSNPHVLQHSLVLKAKFEYGRYSLYSITLQIHGWQNVPQKCFESFLSLSSGQYDRFVFLRMIDEVDCLILLQKRNLSRMVSR